jgi:hypothetical protein
MARDGDIAVTAVLDEADNPALRSTTITFRRDSTGETPPIFAGASRQLSTCVWHAPTFPAAVSSIESISAQSTSASSGRSAQYRSRAKPDDVVQTPVTK